MLVDTITSDLHVALKTHDKRKRETLRFLLAAIQRYDIDTYLPASDKKLTDEDVVKVIRKQVKSHKESIEFFKKANRQELVDKETAELAILESFLPQELSDDEVRNIVKKVLASGVTQFGQVMGVVMKQIAGRSSGERVQKIVKEELKKA